MLDAVARLADEPRPTGSSPYGSPDRRRHPADRRPRTRVNGARTIDTSVSSRTLARDVSAMQSALASRTFRIFTQVNPGGAGGARTHDRRIMRSTATCTKRANCTDATDHRTDSTRRAGIIRRAGPRPGPRLQLLCPAILLPCVTHLTARLASLHPALRHNHGLRHRQGEQQRGPRARQACLGLVTWTRRGHARIVPDGNEPGSAACADYVTGWRHPGRAAGRRLECCARSSG
jgi:hypothetical protein